MIGKEPKAVIARLVSSDAIDWSAAMQVGGQVHAIAQKPPVAHFGQWARHQAQHSERNQPAGSLLNYTDQIPLRAERVLYTLYPRLHPKP